MLGAPVGIEDQIRGNVRPGGLREDMYARRRTSTAHRVADDPAHGVTGRDRPGAYKLFAFLKRDVGTLTGLGLDLLERSIDAGKLLVRATIAEASALHTARASGPPQPAALSNTHRRH